MNRIEQTPAWSAHSAAGDFRIVALEVREGRELLVFYAMRAAQRGVPTVTAHSAGGPPTGPASGTPLPVTAVQSLGALAEFDTGVIHVGWRDPLGPQIVLDVQPPGSPTAAWQVTPVQQIISDPQTRRGSTAFATAYPALQQVSLACPCGSEGFRLALLGRSPQAVPPLYVRLDAEGTVTLLDAAAWNALWPTPPPFQGTPYPTEDLEHPYIAPTYPPTPLGGTPGLPGIPAPVPTGSSAPAAPVSHGPAGIPAIAPTIANAGPDQPAFTEVDVRRYDAAHSPRGFAERAEALTPVLIQRIRFLTVDQLRPRLGGDLGLPGTTLLCYVEYSGTFHLIHPPGMGGPIISHGAAEVFDAHTGNLLQSRVGTADP
jgi:hypothetical protein